MNMITANRLASHDIAIVTVAKDYACIGTFRITTLNMIKKGIIFLAEIKYKWTANKVVCGDIGIVTDALKVSFP